MEEEATKSFEDDFVPQVMTVLLWAAIHGSKWGLPLVAEPQHARPHAEIHLW